MDVDVRLASADDWPSLWPLLVGMGTPDGETVATTEVRFRRLSSDPSWHIALATGATGEPVGYAAAQDHGEPLRGGASGRVARLHDLFVAPSSRRAGVGAALLRDVTAWASTRVRYLQWQAHETEAAPFYERLGHIGQPCPQPEFPEFEIEFSP